MPQLLQAMRVPSICPSASALLDTLLQQMHAECSQSDGEHLPNSPRILSSHLGHWLTSCCSMLFGTCLMAPQHSMGCVLAERTPPGLQAAAHSLAITTDQHGASAMPWACLPSIWAMAQAAR